MTRPERLSCSTSPRWRSPSRRWGWNDLGSIKRSLNILGDDRDPQDDSEEWLSQGEVDFRIVYDDDVYGARIIAEGPSAEGGEDYNVICNHLIGRGLKLLAARRRVWIL